MKSTIGVATVMALAMACLGPGQVAAQPGCGSGMLMKWDADAFAYETAYNSATFISSVGSELDVVGIVSVFCPPLYNSGTNDPDPTDPNTEYTFHFTNLTSAGTVGPTVVAGTTRWTTNYSALPANGNFSIYQDSPRDAPTDAGGMPAGPPNAQVPVRFTDGTLILEGTLLNFRTQIVRTDATGTYQTTLRGDWRVTGPDGGTYWQRLGDGAGGPIISTWCVLGTATGLCNDTELTTGGYSAHPNGKFDLDAATLVQSSTWGAIKQLYR